MVADHVCQLLTGQRPKRGSGASGRTPSHAPSPPDTIASRASRADAEWRKAASMNQCSAKIFAAPASADRSAQRL